MRISLLMEREPFAAILENTLSEFWSRVYSRAICVRWRNSGWGVFRSQAGEQAWLVNIYLNSIFLPSAQPDVFGPIRAEFSRSTSAWRRPIQRAYVQFALTWPASLFFSQASLTVQPGIPDAENILILAGNHKIRLVDGSTRQATVLLKQGFPSEFFESEIKSRQHASSLGLPVPEIHTIAKDGTWFVEAMIQGTPLNRLADPEKISLGRRTAWDALRVLVEKTGRRIPISTYLECLLSTIHRSIAAVPMLDENHRNHVSGITGGLYEEAGSGLVGNQESLLISQTHGDFQPANILLDDTRIWLIDWEYGAERQSVYDLLTLACNTRHPAGLADRLLQFETDIAAFANDLPETWPGMQFDSTLRRRRSAAILLLEELHLRLREISNPLFRSAGAGFIQFQNEVDQWLKQI